MSVHRAYNFRMITGRDWQDAIATARRTPNKVRQQIREHIEKHGNRIAITSTNDDASSVACPISSK